MKLHLKKVTLIIVSIFFLLANSPSVFAKDAINASCSSQIAEAFGKKVLNDFKEKTGLGVNVHIFSSKTCIKRLSNGFSNLAASTIRISQQDKENGLVEIPICRDPMVVVANSTCEISSLTTDQVRKIFSGNITNWKELGGEDMPVTVIVPGTETGAYQNFTEIALKHAEIKYDLMSSESFTAAQAIKHIPGAISFIAAGATRQYPYFHLFKIDNKSPSDKDYPFFQTFSFITAGKPAGAVKEVINYSISERAKAYMKSRGMYPIIE